MESRHILLSALVAVSVFAVVISQAPPAQSSEDITNTCIGCICEAATQCNISSSCSSSMCGPFRITKPYWIDGNSNILPLDSPDNPDAWTNCVKDPQCAGLTVFNYLTRFKQDCNRDGKITCLDYAMIHHLGGYGCGTRDLEPKYRQQLEPCLASIGQLN